MTADSCRQVHGKRAGYSTRPSQDSVDVVAVDLSSEAGQAVANGPRGTAWPATGSWLADVATSDAGLRQVLHGLPGVDQVGAEARAAGLATRSIKKDAKMTALELAVRMVDLTTLEGADTPGKVRGLCAKAMQPDPADQEVPPVAAGAAAAWRSRLWPPRSHPAGHRCR